MNLANADDIKDFGSLSNCSILIIMILIVESSIEGRSKIGDENIVRHDLGCLQIMVEFSGINEVVMVEVRFRMMLDNIDGSSRGNNTSMKEEMFLYSYIGGCRIILKYIKVHNEIGYIEKKVRFDFSIEVNTRRKKHKFQSFYFNGN